MLTAPPQEVGGGRDRVGGEGLLAPHPWGSKAEIPMCGGGCQGGPPLPQKEGVGRHLPALWGLHRWPSADIPWGKPELAMRVQGKQVACWYPKGPEEVRGLFVLESGVSLMQCGTL